MSCEKVLACKVCDMTLQKFMHVRTIVVYCYLNGRKVKFSLIWFFSIATFRMIWGSNNYRIPVHYCILEGACFEERGISIHMQIGGWVSWNLPAIFASTCWKLKLNFSQVRPSILDRFNLFRNWSGEHFICGANLRGANLIRRDYSFFSRYMMKRNYWKES